MLISLVLITSSKLSWKKNLTLPDRVVVQSSPAYMSLHLVIPGSKSERKKWEEKEGIHSYRGSLHIVESSSPLTWN